MAVDALEVLDWRRQIHALYREVRETSDASAAHVHWCRRREQLFRSHPASAGRDARLHHAPYQADLRFEVVVEPAAAERIEIPTATDGVVPFRRVGRVTLAPLGNLDLWWLDSYGGGLWLPLRDGSDATYGGGRYVLDTVKGADLGGSGSRLVVDLNFAYNPSCAYDEAWACPLAPLGNVLSTPLEVGELLPT